MTGQRPESAATPNVQSLFRTLQLRARATNQTRLEQLVGSLAAAGAGSLDDAGRRHATDLAHQIIGSAGTFGFAEASRIAVELEAFFATSTFSPEQLVLGAELLDGVGLHLAADPASDEDYDS
jgi:HPt (histidine-containing phosphotransfer) domain-containing protein